MFLKINRILYPVHNLGPGRRIGIWVQGCSLCCDGCVSPELQTRRSGTDVPVSELIAWCAALRPGYDGITISGGEPFEQYEALVEFCTSLKAVALVQIYLFTGFTLEELCVRHPDREFLQCIDYLLDGRYVRTLHDGQGRGSTNQILYQIQDGEAQQQNVPFASSQFSVCIDEKMNMFMAGIPGAGMLETLQRRLKDEGIRVNLTGIEKPASAVGGGSNETHDTFGNREGIRHADGQMQ